MTETPDLRWFESTDRQCVTCGKRASGTLRGVRNESHGPHCQPCANKRLKASETVRLHLEAQTYKTLEPKPLRITSVDLAPETNIGE